MKLSRWILLLLPALLPAAGAKPLPETTVAQAAARIDRLLEEDLQRIMRQAFSRPCPRVFH